MTQSDSITSFILKALQSFKFLIATLFFLAAVWAIDMSLRPYLLKIMLDRLPHLTAQTAADQLIGPGALYVGMSLLITLIFRIYDLIWIYLNPPLKRNLGDLLMKRMMLHSQELFQNSFAGNLGSRIKDVMSGVPDLIKICIDQLFSHSLAMVIATFTVWSVNYKFALSLCTWIFIFVFGSIWFAQRAKHLSGKTNEVRSRVMGQIVDILSNIMSVRLFARSGYESQRLLVALNEYVAADQKRDWYFLKMFTFQGLSFVIYQAISLIWLITGFQEGSVTPGDFALILTVNISLVDCLWNLSKDIGSFSKLTGEISQGLRIALSPLELADKPDAKQLVVTRGEIIFRDVQFHYKGAEALFHKKSVTIPAGQKVGLVGYSGGGKTTFANLILRLYDVDSGSISIDGQNICDVTQSSLRQALGMIPQDPTLFHRSLIENIRYGRSEASTQEVIEAAKRAYAHDFIIKLPQGYDSLVGERGVKLSGGQRQRIAIARAILKNAPILILDEATSQLDSVTESDIQESLRALIQGKTAIVIAHRLSTLLHMDRILVFDQGRIIEDGTHQELLRINGLYRALWSAQVGGWLPES